MKARDNPLSAERVLEQIRYRPVDLDWDAIMARLEQLKWRCAIVGAKGTGKTTLMEDLSRRLSQQHKHWRMIRLSAEDGRIAPGALDRLSADEIVLLDGAEQLSAARWMRIKLQIRAAGGFIITTHSPGRLPTLLQTRTTVDLLEGIVRDLLPPDVPRLSRSDVAKLLSDHRGNVRDALRRMYDDLAMFQPCAGDD
jgi:GTPase SAR1 family protein